MIHVLGIGNVLMGDDGFGPAVANAFEAAYEVGPNVEVIDIGTPGLDLASWLADVDHAILVDTVRTEDRPGTLHIYQKPALLRQPTSIRAGPHDPGLHDALLALEFAGRSPRALTLVGVVPARIDASLELSAAVSAAIEPAVALVASLVRGEGEAVNSRLPARRPASVLSP